MHCILKGSRILFLLINLLENQHCSFSIKIFLILILMYFQSSGFKNGRYIRFMYIEVCVFSFLSQCIVYVCKYSVQIKQSLVALPQKFTLFLVDVFSFGYGCQFSCVFLLVFSVHTLICSLYKH